MAFTNGNSRTSTIEWKRTREAAKHDLDYTCQRAARGPCAGHLELDHRVPHEEGGSDDLDNLQWLCKRHHAMKSQREAARGRQRRRARGQFEAEAHPGLVG